MKIAVLGLGPSLGLFKPKDFDCSIGVNDIWDRVESEYVVCLDPIKRFSDDRLKTILGSQPRGFYSQLEDYSNMKGFTRIKLQNEYPNRICNLSLEAIPKSYCSPFVAAVIGYKLLKAKELHVFGVDLVNHPKLSKSPSILAGIRRHFINLERALDESGCDLIVHGEGTLKGL